MIDLHTHTFFSDGVLVPSELLQRALNQGYEKIAITDHCDSSNIESVITSIKRACRDWNANNSSMKAVPGVELTYVPPALIRKLTEEARRMGAGIVVVHGETIVEPVTEGTNLAAVRAGVDVLAHPGLIDAEAVEIALQNDVALEITTKSGHSLTNGHVAKLAKLLGATLVINTDTHSPGDLVTDEFAENVVLGCGLEKEDFVTMQETARRMLER